MRKYCTHSPSSYDPCRSLWCVISLILGAIQLFQDKKSLWTPGSAFPEGGSQVLSRPFQFQLPGDSHPSFHCTAEPSHAAAISYSLEVVAEREGQRANHQIRRVFAVVPVATAEELRAKESLQQSRTGPWRDITQEKKMRRGMWGDYSQACATVRSFTLVTTYLVVTHLAAVRPRFTILSHLHSHTNHHSDLDGNKVGFAL